MSEPVIATAEKYWGKTVAASLLAAAVSGCTVWWILEKSFENRTQALQESIKSQQTMINYFNTELSSHRAECNKKIEQCTASQSLVIQQTQLANSQCQADKNELNEKIQKWDQFYTALQKAEQSCQEQLNSTKMRFNDRTWMREREKQLRSIIENEEQLIKVNNFELGELQAFCKQAEQGINFQGGASYDHCVKANALRQTIHSSEQALQARRSELIEIQKVLLNR